MRIFIAIPFLLVLANGAHGSCTDAQHNFVVEPEIGYDRKSVTVGSEGERIDKVTLKIPKGFEGLEIVGMTLSNGGILGIPTYKIPLAYDHSDKFAYTEISVDLDAIGDLNVRFDYKGTECGRSIYKLVMKY